MGCLREDVKGQVRVICRVKSTGKQRNKGRARGVLVSWQRDRRVWDFTKIPGMRAPVSMQETQCSAREPGLMEDAAMANSLPGSPHLRLLKIEGGEGRALNEGGGKIVWVNAFPTLFRLVPPFAS